MDNSGVAKVESSGGEQANAQSFEGGIVDNFGAFAQEQKEAKGADYEKTVLTKGEKIGSAEQAEAVSSALSSVAPVRNATNDDDDDAQVIAESPELKALTEIPIARDAEKLPKPYMDKVVAIIHKDRKNPHRLVTDLDVARWDMMRKAFNRKRGEGK